MLCRRPWIIVLLYSKTRFKQIYRPKFSPENARSPAVPEPRPKRTLNSWLHAKVKDLVLNAAVTKRNRTCCFAILCVCLFLHFLKALFRLTDSWYTVIVGVVFKVGCGRTATSFFQLLMQIEVTEPDIPVSCRFAITMRSWRAILCISIKVIIKCKLYCYRGIFLPPCMGYHGSTHLGGPPGDIWCCALLVIQY